MSGLMWQEVPGGWDARQFRVRRLDRPTERSWQLEIARRGFGWQGEPAFSAHRTRSGAMASARIYEMQRIRSLRLQIHVGVFLAASVAWLIRSTSVNTDIAGFLLWLGLFVVALKSLANALEVLDAAKSTEIERDADRLDAVERWLHADSPLPPLQLREEADTAAEQRANTPSTVHCPDHRWRRREPVPITHAGVLRSGHVSTRSTSLLR